MAKKSDIEVYSTDNEGKSVIAERFIRTLKNKIYNDMTLIYKNMYIGKLNDIVNKQNDTYQSTIQLMPVEVELSTYIDLDKKNNKEDPEFKVGDHVIMQEDKNIKIFLQKAMFQIGLKKYLWLEKKLLKLFIKKNCKKQIKKFRVEKVIKRKGDKRYVKWKGYNNSFNSWTDKKQYK